MPNFKSIGVLACLSFASAAISLPSFAQSPQVKAEDATMDDVRARLNGRTMQDILEQVAAKDPSYVGPAHLFPQNKHLLRKNFLPSFFETLDTLYVSELTMVKFTFGLGDQTEDVKPVNIENIIMFLSQTQADGIINEEIWGSLTFGDIFEAFDLPEYNQAAVNITYRESRQKRLETDTSLSAGYLSVQAKDDMGLWVYSLDMPIGSDAQMITFRTTERTETYRLNGITTDGIQAIRINGKAVYTNETTEKPSVTLRKELGL